MKIFITYLDTAAINETLLHQNSKNMSVAIFPGSFICFITLSPTFLILEKNPYSQGSNSDGYTTTIRLMKKL